MSTATTTSLDTGQTGSRRPTTQPTNTPTNQLERYAADRLRTVVATVRLAFRCTLLGVLKSLALEQHLIPRRRASLDVQPLKGSTVRRSDLLCSLLHVLALPAAMGFGQLLVDGSVGGVFAVRGRQRRASQEGGVGRARRA